MFGLTERERYLHGDPCGFAVSAMAHGRLAYREAPPRLTAKRTTCPPWSDRATPPPVRVPRPRPYKQRAGRLTRAERAALAVLMSVGGAS